MKRALAILCSLGVAVSGFAQSGGTLTLPAGGGSGATIPTTSNLISGDGAGNGADAGFTAASVLRLTAAQAPTNKDYTGAGNTFPTFNQSTTGSAATLTTARTIAGVSFNGSANIALASTNLSDTASILLLTAAQAPTNKDLTGAGNTFPTFNQNTTGSAATLTTPRTIAGVSFNGSANIAIPSSGLSDTANLPLLNGVNVFTGTTQKAPHWASSTSAPTAVASTGGAGAGPPTVTVTGNDMKFHCAFTTGASGTTASSTVFTVTFATAYATAPQVSAPVCYNVNACVAQGSTKALTVNTVTTTGFTVTSGSVALLVSTALDYDFTVIGNP